MNKNSSKKLIEIQIAKLYFLEKLSQEEISAKVHMSRSNVSRIISKCINSGLVRIEIRDPTTLYPEVALRLQSKFNLDNVIIGRSVSGIDFFNIPDTIPYLTTAFLNQILKPNTLVGVTPGKNISDIVTCFTNTANVKADVIQMTGFTSCTCDIYSVAYIVTTLASKLNGEAFLLPAPLMVSDARTKAVLMSNVAIAPVMQQYNNIQVSLMEISDLRVHISPTFKNPWLSKSDALQLKDLQAISQVCGHYFDQEGSSCDAGIINKMLGIDTCTLKKIPISIGIASGEQMCLSTLSAIRAGIVHNLIIDATLAYRLDNL